MSRQLRIRVLGLVAALLSGLMLVVVVVPACSFQAPNMQDGPDDASLLFDSPPDAFIPDAAPCSSLIKTCVAGERLRACMQIGVLPQETICDWDCVDTPEPHCRVLTPSGGAVTPADLDPAMGMAAGLQAKSISTALFGSFPGSINTDTGQISNGLQQVRSSGTGVRDGIDFSIRNGVAVFRFDSLTISGSQEVRVTGANALAIVAIKTITLKDGAKLDVRGTCSGRTAGPGGGQGGSQNSNGSGTGAGGAGDSSGTCSGGGGAGYGLAGGNGGGKNNAGQAFGNATITALVGGSGGGGGGGNGGEGGGGGGAVQLVANGAITFTGTIVQVGINAGGCGGKAGNCGGGAGAGGGILIEGKTVDLSQAYCAANGGGGGGAANGSSGEMGQTSQRANGGNGATPQGNNNDGGDGGDGGDDGSPAAAGSVRDGRGGGGGGGVGWIRINTKSGTVGMGGGVLVSPTLGSTSASTGTVNVQ